MPRTIQQDGSFQSLGSAYHAVNKRVLREAPCSVAVLVDRGLGGPAQVSAKNVSFSVATLLFGGPDDREALAYTTRMAEHPGVAVTLARFRPHSDEESADDEAAVEAFKSKLGIVKDGSVHFEERQGYTKEEVLETINSLSKFNVFVVGRMPPTAPLVENPDELGPVGSYLASPEFRTSASVLVIKRYDPATNPKSKRFDPSARPPAATDEDVLDEEMGSRSTVVPAPWSPTSDAA